MAAGPVALLRAAVYLIFRILIRFFLVSLRRRFSAGKPLFWTRKLHITMAKCAYFAELKTRFCPSLLRVAHCLALFRLLRLCRWRAYVQNPLHIRRRNREMEKKKNRDLRRGEDKSDARAVLLGFNEISDFGDVPKGPGAAI